MSRSDRIALIRRNRPRGIYMPVADVPAHLANGWKLLDDCPGAEEVLLLPPMQMQEERAA